jgi:hypothetical protein
MSDDGNSYHGPSEIFDEIDRTRARLFQSVEALTAEQQGFRPAPDRWSVAQLCDHLSIVEGNVLKLLGKVLAKAEEAGAPPPTSDAPFAPVSIEEFVERTRGVKLDAPEAVRPADTRPVEESLAALRDSRAALHALRPRLERLDAHALRFPHPAWGPLNLYQWLLFLGAHEARHLDQVEALKETINSAPAENL